MTRSGVARLTEHTLCLRALSTTSRHDMSTCRRADWGVKVVVRWDVSRDDTHPMRVPPPPAEQQDAMRHTNSNSLIMHHTIAAMAPQRAACLLLLLAAPLAAARMGRVLMGASDHVYKVHEKVALYANKVGPFHNPRCGYGHVRSCGGHVKVIMTTHGRSRPRHPA